MNILVIGNGFDLAHRLPTRYVDFLEYVQSFQRFKESTENSTSQYYNYFKSLKAAKTLVFQELDKLITDNHWLCYFIRVYKNKVLKGKDNWIDFESEISNVIKALDAVRVSTNEQFEDGNSSAQLTQSQLNIICPVLNLDGRIQDYRMIKYTPELVGLIKATLLEDLKKLIRCLEIYLFDYISFEKCDHLKDIADLEIDKVLSFNYTDTYRQIYDKVSNSKIEYDFIHGKADINNDINSCKLVLGIDEYLSGDAMNKDNEFIQFKKFYQRINKGTGCHYVDWLYEFENKVKTTSKSSSELNIYIYGHSLDITDADIIEKLIKTDGAKTTIFHHSQDTLGKQIANLVKVIGEEELIKRTDGKKRTIIFKQSSSETI